jgi:hypothetical protein
MKANQSDSSTVWLRTDRRVTQTNGSTPNDASFLQGVLRQGINAAPDLNRPDFYEIEVAGQWYYIHIPNRISVVYVVSVRSHNRRFRTQEPIETNEFYLAESPK